MHRRRFTVIAALTLDGVAGHVIEGSLRRNGYLHFLKHCRKLGDGRDFNDILVRFIDVLGTFVCLGLATHAGEVQCNNV